ncbi:MAG: acetyl-CoA hydrolase/transferase family protein [Pseudodesulfovibrio sp.]|uniref:Acetyl-CoA hydrolase/transferase n=1 Tax=Pseudodesulfovibrio aespoeensis (strain ATCC 700646 / DSM 10631 / Aspo-2) TaxID=643562 RepID=E6VZH2_PSEA9|nr:MULTISPECIES: acetyl-CoA hydrolase/transferase C-terminal domain-containing protein [Pseudodesulfovibrio]MBU4191658.1 4-hydroxybutyrate--acetyl-CoA CoA transferase [Pseudomonadota bacterium]ADU61686.1 acetyl-CoA hydrolase/transferase [Pseudodesulfovibrio aespoeensis Aspo-2]MBU4244312.1 4-hydroxybutyrate--acetyl-CoA CoA transferase [Pseudomonadota bacterium]MBU4379649.1 4-hydroxybutyrate--acetyl-CoA CoA transferase [Pseudomonadota bacterium]MBU4517503.1 4-hydroxybutyrate--acetyl-CoA CoA tran
MNPYASQYREKLTSAHNAVSRIRDGATVIHGVTLAEPPALLAALADRARSGDVKDVSIYSFNPQRHAAETYLKPDLVDSIFAKTWFLSAAVRKLAATGIVQFIPSYLHQVPKFIREYMQVDACLTTVSPMDKAGYFSFGTANDLTSTAAREAATLVVEVNENMPRVFGDSPLHISEVDAIVENHVPLMELPPPPPRPEDEAVGRLVAEIIPDGAVLQLGIGSLPNAICPCLTGHRDLGIHSELFGPGMVDLIRQGIVTGRRKTLLPGKHVFSLAYGTRDTFDFMHDNPSLASAPSDYVMHPAVIAQNDNMIAVNSIIQVDLTGQCNAEFMGGQQFSGTGGQLDFVRGAYAAKGGKSVLTFYSTAKGGTISRVVPRLDPDAVVTTPRMDVHYLCTEHGLVNLKHRSVGERAMAIITIAHPDFRDQLMREAERMRLL